MARYASPTRRIYSGMSAPSTVAYPHPGVRCLPVLEPVQWTRGRLCCGRRQSVNTFITVLLGPVRGHGIHHSVFRAIPNQGEFKDESQRAAAWVVPAKARCSIRLITRRTPYMFLTSLMRTAIYARVSTADQSCEMQLRELREYLSRRGWELAGEYVDTGWSGAHASRPELNRLMRDARMRRFDTVVVWKLDRWGRSVVHSIKSIQELTALGIRFVALTQNIDTDESSPTSQSSCTSSLPGRSFAVAMRTAGELMVCPGLAALRPGAKKSGRR